MNKNCERVMNKVNMCRDMHEVLLILKGLYELRDTKEDSRVIAGINNAIELVKERIKEIERGDYMFSEHGLIRNSNKHAYNGNDRTDKLTKRFFKILEEGGEWTELFLIRDLLLEEYINNRFGFLGILQIDDIIEEALERDLEENEPVIEMYYLDDVVNNIYKSIGRGDIDGAFALVNAYGDNAQSNPYIYYCAVRELERITGETLVELCL